jgi:hypothetical protein
MSRPRIIIDGVAAEAGKRLARREQAGGNQGQHDAERHHVGRHAVPGEQRNRRHQDGKANGNLGRHLPAIPPLVPMAQQTRLSFSWFPGGSPDRRANASGCRGANPDSPIDVWLKL